VKHYLLVLDSSSDELLIWAQHILVYAVVHS